MAKIAIVQESPAFLDRGATIEKAVALIEKAAAQGSALIVFPEAFIPGYPSWIWRLRPGGDFKLAAEIHGRLLDNSVDLKSNDLAPLFLAAKQHGVTVVCGMHERDAELSRATLYNTVVVIGPEVDSSIDTGN